jgi:hypothetical protein
MKNLITFTMAEFWAHICDSIRTENNVRNKFLDEDIFQSIGSAQFTQPCICNYFQTVAVH